MIKMKRLRQRTPTIKRYRHKKLKTCVRQFTRVQTSASFDVKITDATEFVEPSLNV